jgi:hypothetical protein
MIQTIKEQHVLGKIGASNLCVLAETNHVMMATYCKNFKRGTYSTTKINDNFGLRRFRQAMISTKSHHLN